MKFEQLRALVAVVDEGSFEGAGFVLGVTPSAVSQRIKALESFIGGILVRRASPCLPTEAGEAVLRMARQVLLLEADTWHELGKGPGQRMRLPVAVNADSLATWFIPVMEVIAGWDDIVVHLHVEDQGHSSRLLRAGEVMAAITSDPTPIPGCSMRPLGSMRYVAAATSSLLQRHSTDSGPDWRSLPVVQFNDKDDLQNDVLRAQGVASVEAVHRVPSSEGFYHAVAAGLGWGMLPELQLQTAGFHSASRGEALQPLHVSGTELYADVPLYWQMWNLSSERLSRLSAAVESASRVLT